MLIDNRHLPYLLELQATPSMNSQCKPQQIIRHALMKNTRHILAVHSSLTEWNPSMGLPRAPDHFFHPKRSKVVVFVNPDDQLRIGAAAQLSESDRPTAGSFVVKPAAQLPIECGTQKNSLEEEDRNKNTTAHQRPNPIASMQGQGFGRKSTSEEQEENRDDEDLHSG